MYKKIIIFFIVMIVSINIFAKTNKFIDFTLKNLNNEEVKLNEIVGDKVILLNFWTTWCPYCVKEIPELVDIYSKYKDKGLEILAVNIQENHNQIKKFVSRYKMEYPVLLDTNANVARSYGVRGIPTNFLIDINGDIVFAHNILPPEDVIIKSLDKLTNQTIKLQKNIKKKTK